MNDKESTEAPERVSERLRPQIYNAIRSRHGHFEAGVLTTEILAILNALQPASAAPDTPVESAIEDGLREALIAIQDSDIRIDPRPLYAILRKFGKQIALAASATSAEESPAAEAASAEKIFEREILPELDHIREAASAEPETPVTREQQREESGDTLDAARYRFLRDVSDADEQQPYICQEQQDSWGTWRSIALDPSEADTLIDAAMAAQPVSPPSQRPTGSDPLVGEILKVREQIPQFASWTVVTHPRTGDDIWLRDYLFELANELDDRRIAASASPPIADGRAETGEDTKRLTTMVHRGWHAHPRHDNWEIWSNSGLLLARDPSWRIAIDAARAASQPTPVSAPASSQEGKEEK